MRIHYVEGISWSGGSINTYVILKNGPLLEDSIVSAPTVFLISLAQRGLLKNSIKAAADDLKGFFQALSDHGQDWRELTDRDMSGYLYGHLLKARALEEKSILRHKTTIKMFYQHSWELGFLDAPPNFSYTYASNNLKSQGESHKKVNFDLYNNYIATDIFKSLLSNVAAQSPFEKERDELVLHIGYYCGLRTSEVTDPRNLLTADLRRLISIADNCENISINIPIIGKGEKLRNIDVPPRAFLHIKRFLEGRRAKISDGPLICKSNGESLSPEHATYVFRMAKIFASAIIDDVISELHNKDSYMHFVNKASFVKLTFHSLRHTYATNLVDFCYKHGFDPWQYVPEQMGHEDEETTKAYVVFDGKLHRREKIRRALNDELDE
ncbi:tyrosine-type recombinase/integrase [Pseudomonas tussilaginis]|uniref:tyrosine-type recombinase/integrase n=1 Tax=Pseudomonas sp. 5 TaxID=1619949 RepID=UPI000B0BECB6|nr:site-specific integrase [Pseudomonas sp. 5]